MLAEPLLRNFAHLFVAFLDAVITRCQNVLANPLQRLIVKMRLYVREGLFDRLQDIEESLDVGHGHEHLETLLALMVLYFRVVGVPLLVFALIMETVSFAASCAFLDFNIPSPIVILQPPCPPSALENPNFPGLMQHSYMRL